LLDAVRSQTLSQVLARLGPRVAADVLTGFGAYPKTYSVPRGGQLQVCAHMTGADQEGADWKVARVTGLADFFAPSTDDNSWSASGSFTATREDIPWNAEEVGYGWSVSLKVDIPSGAPLGLYAVKFTQPIARAVYFIVRRAPTEPPSPILLHWPWSTTAAYAGPNDHGSGLSGHENFTNVYNSFQPSRLRRVSIDRPFDFFAYGDKRPLTHEGPFNVWRLMTETPPYYDVDGCTSFDLDSEALIFAKRQLFVSVGHDEYWSENMRKAVEDFVANGGNAAFFSANVAWWRVRFEGPGNRIMACYKSAIDDPVGSEDPNSATGNWCSTDRPENTLTGGSYRRGTQAPVKCVIVRPDDPLMENVPLPNDNTIPANSEFSGVETDAVDYPISPSEWEDGKKPHPTGADGSPLDFVILGIADSLESGTQRGRGTMGYFSRASGGRVFLGSTTDWGQILGDPSIEKITRNVIAAFSKPFASGGPDWRFASREKPMQKWRPLRTMPTAAAIVGIVQGDLLVHDLSLPNNLLRLDPENPTANVPLDTRVQSMFRPYSGVVGGYSCDLFGADLYVADHEGPDPIWYIPNPSPRASTGWSKLDDVPSGGCWAIAAVGGINQFPAGVFAVLKTDTHKDAFLYHGGGGSWRRLGRTTPPMLAMTATDGKLFGVGPDGMIYCRESSAVDLVWSPICDAPIKDGMTYSLAAYYGRLFALAGPLERGIEMPPEKMTGFAQASISIQVAEPPVSGIGGVPKSPGIGPPERPVAAIPKAIFERTLFWRTATSDFGSITPHMLFVKHTQDGYTTISDVDGDKQLLVPAGAAYSVGQLEGNGYFRTTGFGYIPGIVFDQVVRVGRDKALFFDKGIGQGWVYRFEANGHSAQLPNGYSDKYESWEHIVYVHEANSSDPERVFFFDGEKVGTIVHYVEDGSIATSDWRNDFSQWDLVTATWSGRLVFYSKDGWVAWGHLDKNGKYVDDGELNLGDDYKGYEQIVPAGNEYVVFYRATQASVAIARVDGAFRFTTPASATSFSNRLIGASANGLLLFYDKPPGTGAARTFGAWDPSGGAGGLDEMGPDYPAGSFVGDWTQILSLGVL
jgi:hypothetical protein